MQLIQNFYKVAQALIRAKILPIKMNSLCESIDSSKAILKHDFNQITMDAT